MIERKEFMRDRDHTGREIVTFHETGKSYYVEYVEPRSMDKRGWGDIDPATKKVTGTYGAKYQGAIKAEESMIIEENGFNDIREGSGSPYSTINAMHEEWKRNNNW